MVILHWHIDKCTLGPARVAVQKSWVKLLGIEETRAEAESKLAELLREALTRADTLALSFVAIRVSEAIDAMSLLDDKANLRSKSVKSINGPSGNY